MREFFMAQAQDFFFFFFFWSVFVQPQACRVEYAKLFFRMFLWLVVFGLRYRSF
ncbi:hypothetical protein FPQ18DRAFT_354947 [Pyronema domesticum]|nr:hypothetical protein FPQ18DRAFT_354947 [Pyronema domesticum]